VYDHTAYGLHVRSAFPLPALPAAGAGRGKADVRVYPGTLAPPRPDGTAAPHFARVDERGAYYFVEGIGGLLVRGGREVVADPLPEGEGCFDHLVAGIGMGLVLHQRGALTLHASAVAVGGGVVAFVGWKGTGKSTTAAAFHGSGYRVVTDDLLAVRLDGAGPVVVPGPPSLKLWPEAAAAALGDRPEALPRLLPGAEKRARPVAGGPDPTPLPLLAVYVLDYVGSGAKPGIEPLTGREAYVELVRHAFALRILGASGESPALFRQRVRLARRVPVRRLLRERRLSGLAGVVKLVEEDLAVPPATAPVAA